MVQNFTLVLQVFRDILSTEFSTFWAAVTVKDNKKTAMLISFQSFISQKL